MTVAGLLEFIEERKIEKSGELRIVTPAGLTAVESVRLMVTDEVEPRQVLCVTMSERNARILFPPELFGESGTKTVN